MNQRVTDLIKYDDIRNWKENDIISIKAGTGVGKSYFIKNQLHAFAKLNNKKILFLVHRTNCKNQFVDEIAKDRKADTIDIRTYQAIENVIMNKGIFDLSQYQYIVCDEFHYFISDASFNITTDISLNEILQQQKAIKIFMSATGDYVKNYMKNVKNLHIINYEIPITYDFIKTLTFFNFDETLESFAEQCIKDDAKSIFFIESAEKAYNLYIKFKDKSIFNCSKSNNKYYKYVDSEKINTMLKEQKFNENILITTTCMDAGVNLIDLNLKHIVCDVGDIGTLIQCIGRKRQQNDDDKIYLYIKAITNEQLGGKETQLKNKIKKADFLRKHTVKEYIKEFPRSNDYTNIIYDEVINDENNCTKKINELMYFKCNSDISDIQCIKMYKDFGYCKYIAYMFGFVDEETKEYNYRLIEEDKHRNKLEEYLESNIGKKLYKEDRKELIDLINLRQDGKQLKSAESFNASFKEQKIPYIIEVPERLSYRDINGKVKKEKTYWIICKKVGLESL